MNDWTLEARTDAADWRRKYERENPRQYRIVRFYFDAGIRRRTIRDRVTLAEAQAHCNDPETSSRTCTTPESRRRTRTVGEWFDGYEER